MRWLILLGSALMLVALASCANVMVMPAPVQVEPGVPAASPLAQAVLVQQCGAENCTLYPVEVQAGQPLAGLEPLDLKRYSLQAFSPDGRTLAVVSYHDNTTLSDGQLSLVNLQQWQPVTTTLTFDHLGWLLFSPDGAMLLAGSFDQQLNPTSVTFTLVQIARQQIVAQATVPFLPRLVRFTPDGRGVMVYGIDSWQYGAVSDARPHVALLDAADLSLTWQTTLAEVRDGMYLLAPSDHPEEDTISWSPAVVAAPDRPALYLVHADEDRLTVVEFDRRRVATVALAPRLSWVERLLMLTARPAYAKVLNGTSKQAVVSPDGRYLYVVGTTYDYHEQEQTLTPLGLQVVESATGAEVAQLVSAAESVALAPDGERLYLHGWHRDPSKPYAAAWTEVVTTDHLEVIGRIEGYHLTPSRRLDGQPVLLASGVQQNGQTGFGIVAPVTLEMVHTWAGDGGGWWVLPEGMR